MMCHNLISLREQPEQIIYFKEVHKMCTISNFSKQLIQEDNKCIKAFIRNLKGGQDDEDDFAKLTTVLDYNKLGIPTEIQEKIDEFVNCELAPMVFESHIVFAESHSVGTKINGVQHIDTDEDMFKMFSAFFNVLLEVEKKWDTFAEKELKPYLI